MVLPEATVTTALEVIEVRSSRGWLVDALAVGAASVCSSCAVIIVDAGHWILHSPIGQGHDFRINVRAHQEAILRVAWLALELGMLPIDQRREFVALVIGLVRSVFQHCDVATLDWLASYRPLILTSRGAVIEDFLRTRRLAIR
jgi:hypothetical protein